MNKQAKSSRKRMANRIGKHHGKQKSVTRTQNKIAYKRFVAAQNLRRQYARTGSE